MIKFVLNRGLSRPLFYSRVPAMEHLRFKPRPFEAAFLQPGTGYGAFTVHSTFWKFLLSGTGPCFPPIQKPPPIVAGASLLSYKANAASYPSLTATSALPAFTAQPTTLTLSQYFFAASSSGLYALYPNADTTVAAGTL